MAVALYHLHLKNISRADGRFAVAAAAYRAGARLWNAAEGRFTDFANRRDVVHSELMAPAGAPEWATDREELWNRVEAKERRKDARLAKEIECALPVELPRAEQIELARRFAAGLVELGLVVDLAVHDSGDGNPHVHLQMTTRPVTESGFGDKLRSLDGKAFLTRLRREWAELTNTAYGAAGLDARVDHRSLKDQGIKRTPQRHRGPQKRERVRRRTRRGDRAGRDRQREVSPTILLAPTNAREERMTLSVYDELKLVQEKLNEVERRTPESMEAHRERDGHAADLTARRDFLVGTLRREELERGRGMDEADQRKLLELWDARNQPVPDQDGRPVSPANYAMFERDDPSKRPRGEVDWDNLNSEQKRELILRRTRLREIGAEITEITQQIDKIERSRFMSQEKKTRLVTPLMHRQIDLQREENRIALKDPPEPKKEREGANRDEFRSFREYQSQSLSEVLHRDRKDSQGDGLDQDDQVDRDDRFDLDDLR